MLDAVCRYLPAPIDVEAVKGTNPDTEKEELRRPDAKIRSLHLLSRS